MNGQTIIIILLGLIVAKLYPNWWVYPLIATIGLVIFFALRSSFLWLTKNAMPVIYALAAILCVSFLAAFMTALAVVKHFLGQNNHPFDLANAYYSSLSWIMYMAISATIIAAIVFVIEKIISLVKKSTK